MFFCCFIHINMSLFVSATPAAFISKPLLSQWDEALLTMSKGETARLEIEPEWAYGKKGVPDSKYPFLWLIVIMIKSAVQIFYVVTH